MNLWQGYPMSPPTSPEGRKLTESQLQYTADIQAALSKRNARIGFLEAELEKLERATLASVRREAWAEGQQHEIEHLARTGEFCSCGEKCNPYSAQE
jgi:hypothetical protein